MGLMQTDKKKSGNNDDNVVEPAPSLLRLPGRVSNTAVPTGTTIPYTNGMINPFGSDLNRTRFDGQFEMKAGNEPANISQQLKELKERADKAFQGISDAIERQKKGMFSQPHVSPDGLMDGDYSNAAVEVLRALTDGKTVKTKEEIENTLKKMSDKKQMEINKLQKEIGAVNGVRAMINETDASKLTPEKIEELIKHFKN